MTDQLEFSPGEILATGAVTEPLFAGGRRCHGGFDGDGRYVSPRTLYRQSAIEAWQAHHTETFDTEILDVPLATWPEHFPSVEQAELLLRHGVRDPLVATLTRIGTVEGFGAMIRHSAVPEIQRHFDDDLRGTATAHLDQGLLEAHARDEAGHGDEAGHREMWFAARDVAFEHPVTEDQTHEMLTRMGVPVGGGGVDAEAMRRQAEAMRRFPDLDLGLEMLIQRMIRILLIEIQAFHVFAWAETVLADDDLVAGDGEAARLVSYIRQDETPHVEYLKTSLTEMRDRTFVGTSGGRIAGTEVVGRLWSEALEESLGSRRVDGLNLALREVERALDGRSDGDDLLEAFHAAGSIRPDASGRFTTDAAPA